MTSGNQEKGTAGVELSSTEVQLWREALEQLRHLSSDVWRSFKLFLFLDATVLSWALVFLAFRPVGRWSGQCLALTAAVGFVLTLAARFFLRRQRIYYLQMLAKKSLLESECGLYARKFRGSDTDFALPWRLGAEVVEEIRDDFDAWVEKSIRSSGTMARIQFLIYEVIMFIFACLTVIGVVLAFQARSPSFVISVPLS